MKNKLFIANTVFLLMIGSAVYADAPNIDFSKAYVVPEKSGVDKITIAGVKPIWSDLFFSVDFLLNPSYNLEVQGVLNQSSTQEQLEQSLRNTRWKGSYKFNDENFTTTLKLVVVQDGYVGGEIVHSESVAAGDSYLRSRVTGDILNQYEINGVFIDQDRLSPQALANLPADTLSRQLVRIKRMRALEFRNDDSGWSANREYRMTLENGILSGIVGIPNDTYGSDDGTSSNGDIVLELVK